jgi:hypothetical protein
MRKIILFLLLSSIIPAHAEGLDKDSIKWKCMAWARQWDTDFDAYFDGRYWHWHGNNNANWQFSKCLGLNGVSGPIHNE